VKTFSVIIPLYNGAAHIRKTLDSVLAQTFEDWEAVITDDGSTDGGAGSREVEAFAKEHPERDVRLLHQENKGLGGARNSGIRASRGTFIALLDQDDFWFPGKLAAVKAAFARDPEPAIVCHQEVYCRGGRRLGPTHHGPAGPELFRGLLFGGNRFSTSGMTLRREVFEKTGYFREDIDRIHFVEDYDLWLRAAFHGLAFSVLEEPLGEVTLHEGNFSLGAEEAMCLRTLNVMDDHYAKLLDRRFGDLYRLRRQKSRVWIDSAYLLFQGGGFAGALRCLLRAALQNPLLIDSLAAKLFGRLRRG